MVSAVIRKLCVVIKIQNISRLKCKPKMKLFPPCEIISAKVNKMIWKRKNIKLRDDSCQKSIGQKKSCNCSTFILCGTEVKAIYKIVATCRAIEVIWDDKVITLRRFSFPIFALSLRSLLLRKARPPPPFFMWTNKNEEEIRLKEESP